VTENDPLYIIRLFEVFFRETIDVCGPFQWTSVPRVLDDGNAQAAAAS
jgi:hypothetical protein